jgi:hypothetical protein
MAFAAVYLAFSETVKEHGLRLRYKKYLQALEVERAFDEPKYSGSAHSLSGYSRIYPYSRAGKAVMIKKPNRFATP